MSTAQYRVTVNGFWCHNQSWDDALNLDGKADELFIAVNTKVVGRDGTVRHEVNSESELMGDTWRLPGRVQAGSASDRGGVVTGDKFPSATPWRRSAPPGGDRFPPYVIWEGELADDGDMVMLTPTIWEYDPGVGFLQGWIDWHVRIDNTYGQRAKEIFGSIWPVSRPVFDAVSLGIQTLGKAPGMWGPFGSPMRRPIGLQRDPADPDGFLFNPSTIALSSQTAAYLSGADLSGLGRGIVELRYADDPYLGGVYSVFVQVERTGGEPAHEWVDVGHANDVVAMTALDGRLYCATADNGLWMRDPVHREVDWARIGHANGVRALAADNGRLYCATADNRLWTRDPVPREVDWTEIGHANDVVGMTASAGRLFCATRDGQLWARDEVLANIDWMPIGTAEGVVAMAAGSGSLFSAAGGVLARREPVLSAAAWQPIGTAAGVRGLAALGGDLYAATDTNRLLVRSLA